MTGGGSDESWVDTRLMATQGLLSTCTVLLCNYLSFFSSCFWRGNSLYIGIFYTVTSIPIFQTGRYSNHSVIKIVVATSLWILRVLTHIYTPPFCADPERGGGGGDSGVRTPPPLLKHETLAMTLKIYIHVALWQSMYQVLLSTL